MVSHAYIVDNISFSFYPQLYILILCNSIFLNYALLFYWLTILHCIYHFNIFFSFFPFLAMSVPYFLVKKQDLKYLLHVIFSQDAGF